MMHRMQADTCLMLATGICCATLSAVEEVLENGLIRESIGRRRYSSEAALETLGGAFEDACKTLQDFQEVFSRELQRPSAFLLAADLPGRPCVQISMKRRDHHGSVRFSPLGGRSCRSTYSSLYTWGAAA